MAKIKVKNPEAPKKKKGPIRFEAIIPITIIFLIFFCFFKFFFDYYLKMGIEFGATYANGAEVNVGSVSTSFLGASAKISNIQVTNKEKPEENTVQIGSMSFKTEWDGLLRGKIIISDSSITDIMINTKRKSKGKVLPEKKSADDNVTSTKTVALQETQKALDGNIFGDVAAVAGGTDYKEQLKTMEGKLKSSQFIDQMQKELKEKEAAWKERLAKMPKSVELKALEARAKAIKPSGKDPSAYLKAAKEAEAIYKEVDAKYKMIKESKDDLSADLKKYKDVYGDVKKFVDEDIKDLEGKLGIPSLDAKDLAMRVFGREYAGQIAKAEKYMRLAREYMPPPKKPGEKPPALTPREREKGRDYKFPITSYYPKFWLKKAHISSKASEGGFSGTIAGELRNISTEPQVISQPAEAELKGDFPNSNIFGVQMLAVVDHRTNSPKESGLIKVGAFPLYDKKFSDSKDLTFGFKKAEGSSTLKAELQEENVSLTFDASFDKMDYIVEAEKAKVKEIITNIAQGLGALTLHGSAKGTWSNLDLDLGTNLGDRMQEAFKAEFNKQIAGLKEKLRSEIEGKISGQKEKLMSQVGDFEKKIGIPLKNQEEALNALKGKVSDAGNGGGSPKEQVKEKAAEGAKKLLKGLKF